MTYAARQVLDDLRKVHKILEDETTDDGWRLNWILAVTLARAVGHVLSKVDVAEGRVSKAHSDSAYAAWKRDQSEHNIFRNFIEVERNSVLKEYESTVLQSDNLPILVDDGNGSMSVEILTENLYRPIEYGEYAGSDARDILGEAIDWWEAELVKLETLQKEP